MSGNMKEKIYNGIMVFCVVLCIYLIGQVAAAELTGGAGEIPLHEPPLMRRSEEQALPGPVEGLGISEGQLEAELGKYIPKELPLRSIRAEIGADGSVRLEGELSKSALADYMKSYGMELPGGSMLLLAAPEQLEFAFAAMCSRDDESGMVTVTPREILLAGTEIPAEQLPADLLAGFSDGLNRLLLAASPTFGGIRFEENMLYLLP